MKNSGQGKKLFVRRILVAVALALSIGAPAATVKAAASHHCGWQTGCAAGPVVCLDKETGKEIGCEPYTGHKIEDADDGWQTGLPHTD
jgi:hypothetical protein